MWNDEATFVSLAMVKDGYAQAKLYEPNDKHWDTISAAGTEARAADERLWGACAYFGEPQTTEPPTLEEDTYVPAPELDAGRPRSVGKSGCNPLTARDGDGDGIVCEK